MPKDLFDKPFAAKPVSYALAFCLLLPLCVATPALAHHVMEAFPIKPSPFTGLLSGLLHPALGVDHLIFLMAIGLVGLRQQFRWVIGLLAIGLIGALLGLAWPNSLPGAEAWIGISLALEALVLLDRLPKTLLLPAIGLHGFVLSASVLGWEPTPVIFYLFGLLISQGLLIWISLKLVKNLWSNWGSAVKLKIVSGILFGIGSSLIWSTLVP
ncbi:MAG: HupE/UreJ family protein [Cyanobacteria bacterium]|nr:HupE/UreJ family protein [Cyanobacteriota bacterium]